MPIQDLAVELLSFIDQPVVDILKAKGGGINELRKSLMPFSSFYKVQSIQVA